MAINEDLLYEVNDKGERVIVKSIESENTAYLRFTNRTSRPVDIWWRDFEGIKRHYIRLEAGAFYDVNSFLTHPWEFKDASTNENYVINNQAIFRAPNHVGGMLYRTNWNISVMVRSLRRTTLMALATLLPNPETATMLGLPLTLGRELADLVNTLQNTPEIKSPQIPPTGGYVNHVIEAGEPGTPSKGNPWNPNHFFYEVPNTVCSVNLLNKLTDSNAVFDSIQVYVIPVMWISIK